MKYFLFLALSVFLFACSESEPAKEPPDYGLLILQKRIDTLEYRLDSVIASQKTNLHQLNVK
jgi:hypothetical protein